MNKYICLFIPMIFFTACIPNLKGKQIPHKPDITGMYILHTSDKEKEDILKLKILVIFENSKKELEYYFKNFTRLSFHVSDNREEIITRRGFVLTSDTEILFRESNMEEEQKLYYGPKESNPRNWTNINMGPRSRVRFIEKEPPSGYDRIAVVSKDFQEITIKDEVYRKIGDSFIGAIVITNGKKKLKLQNNIVGAVYYISKSTGEIASIIPNANELESGFKMEIHTSNGKINASIENKSKEFVFLKTDKFDLIQKYDRVSPVGIVDKKVQMNKAMDPDELIRKIKANKNLSKEDLIKELEKMKK